MRVDNYIKNHLASFIAYELNKGHSIRSIKHVLMRKGHHPNLVDEAIRFLEKSNFKPSPIKNPPYGRLDAEMFEHMVKVLENYVNVQLENGYPLDEIKQTLVNYGHSYELIDKAVANAMGMKKVEHRKKEFDFSAYILPACLISLLLILVFTSISTDEPIFTIILGFVPTILTLVTVEMFWEKAKQKNVFFFVPLAWTFIFYVLMINTRLGAFSGMSVVNLMVLNLILSIVFTAFFFFKKG